MSAGKMFGALFIILAVIWLFSEAFEFMEIIVFSMLIVNGIVWFAVSGVYGSKLEKTQSKMFDLSGGRDVFEY